MVSNIDAVLDHAQTLVIGNKDPEFSHCPRTLGEIRS